MKAEQVLQGYSEAEQKRISQICQDLGISRDDPMFQLMATLGRYEETMIDLQARMEGMVEAWAVVIDQKLEATSKAAHSMHYTVVSSAVREEIKKLQSASKGVNTSVLNHGKLGFWGLSTIGGGIMALGALVGCLITWNVISNLGKQEAVVVSPNDLKVLEWAKSKEGKQMYKLLLENEATITACQQENRLQGHCLIRIPKK